MQPSPALIIPHPNPEHQKDGHVHDGNGGVEHHLLQNGDEFELLVAARAPPAGPVQNNNAAVDEIEQPAPTHNCGVHCIGTFVYVLLSY